MHTLLRQIAQKKAIPCLGNGLLIGNLEIIYPIVFCNKLTDCSGDYIFLVTCFKVCVQSRRYVFCIREDQ